MKLILLMCILFIGDVAHAMTSSEQKQATESKNTAVSYYTAKAKDYNDIAKVCEDDRKKHNLLNGCDRQWHEAHEWDFIKQELINKPLEFFIEENDNYNRKN
jgi:hypothetical protein